MNVNLLPIIHRWQHLSILVIGDAMLDRYLQGHSERLCQEAPVPVVNITQQQNFAGGAANVAVNIARLGARVSLLTVLGADQDGTVLQALLAEQGVSISQIMTNPDRSTLVKQRVLANQHLLLRLDQGNTDVISPMLEKQLMTHLQKTASTWDGVIISDYGYGILTKSIIQFLSEQQKIKPCTLIIDAKNLELYQTVKATAVKPNYLETIRLLGLPKRYDQRLEQILPYGDRLLHLTGAASVTVTLDREGTILFASSHPPIHFPATPVPDCQTSGAGDTFVSVLALALTANAPMQMATFLAMTAAKVVTSSVGSRFCCVEDLSQSLTLYE
jgi:D-beta-D-heptose 7-phosphate kinase / D-beta-D-heptose 1-phosphate adenosyltransferase